MAGGQGEVGQTIIRRWWGILGWRSLEFIRRSRRVREPAPGDGRAGEICPPAEASPKGFAFCEVQPPVWRTGGNEADSRRSASGLAGRAGAREHPGAG